MFAGNLLAIAALLGIATASAASKDESAPSFNSKIIPEAYIIELADDADASSFLGNLRTESRVKTVSTRHTIDSDVFKGVSFQVESSSATDEETTKMILNLPQVKQIWPVELIHLPVPQAEIKSRSEVRKRADEYLNYAPHVLTQVDRLNAAGYKGQGLKIAVVDTGIDYMHPALGGGCYGSPECLVTHGADLVGDDYNGSAPPVPDDDPIDQCHGHGTHVAGIVAAQPGFDGPPGAAPGVKLGAYRALSCLGYSSTDLMIASVVQAYNDGNDIITGSIGDVNGWSQHPFALAVSRIVEKGVPCTFAGGNEGGGSYGLFSSASPSAGDGVMAISSFENAQTPSSFTSWGPTFEMDLKPHFGTPGSRILSTYPVTMGSYAVLSGTSMATPLAAAIVALISQVRGTLKPRDLQRAISSTASQAAVRYLPGGASLGLAPVAQQGAGMIQAWDAAYVNSHFSVPNLSFNDTEHFVSKTSFKIKNDGDLPTTYNLYHTPALTGYTFATPPYRSSSVDLSAIYATLTLEPSTFTLKRGDSAKIRVSVKQPIGLIPENLPVYSGWINVNASNSAGPFKISLPYVGAASALRSHVTMPIDRIWLSQSTDYMSSPISQNFTFQLTVPSTHPEWAAPLRPTSASISALNSLPSQILWNLLGTAELRMEVIPLPPTTPTNATSIPPPAPKPNSFGTLTLGNVARFPKTYVTPIGASATWNGAMADGTYVPPGNYKLLVSSLRIFGDRKVKSDWDIYESVGFGIRYI